MFNTITRTRRLIAAGSAALALTTVGAALDSSGPASAASFTSSNTGQTATGAYLQSAGVCGYGQFNFRITALRLERLQIGISGAAGTVWGASFPIGQSYARTIPVPAFRGYRYYIRGWDWTAYGWRSVTVLTSFWYPHTGMTLNGC